MKIKVKCTPGAVVPTKAHSTDVGFDLVATDRNFDEFGNIVYNTGLALEIPEGFMGFIMPRSSISKKTLALANSIGLVDPDYRGEVLVKFKPTPYCESRTSEDYEYEVGDKIAQLVILPFPTVELQLSESLTETSRGEGGFGSTGN